jgi:hypothetical protein
MFRQGLKSEVRMELMRTGVAITDLRDLIEEATRIDNNLLEFRLEIRGPETHWKSQQNHRSTNKRPRKNFQPRGNLRPRVPGESPVTARRHARATTVTNPDTSRRSAASQRKPRCPDTST